jgi:hypothetical protein
MRIESISSGSSLASIVWAKRISERMKLKRARSVSTSNGILEVDRINSYPPRIFKSLKPNITDIYIINGNLTIPESILYNGERNTIYGIDRYALQRIDQLLSDVVTNDSLPYIIHIDQTNVQDILRALELGDYSFCLSSIKYTFVPGMMVDMFY